MLYYPLKPNLGGSLERFIATYDLHFGWERKAGHKVPVHDVKAWNAVLKFAKDFKPTTWIHGGDMLDCRMISHHTRNKPGQVEGLRLLADAQDGREFFIKPVEEIVGKGNLVYILGNHEDWLRDLSEEIPGLEGLLSVEELLKLKKWKVVPQGGFYNLGKLTFIHGDTLSGGDNVAKNAVLYYERNVRFGHFHTHQTYTKNSALDLKNAKTGVAVPCLCSKNPQYGEGRPNKWSQGFLWGYVREGGFFNDYVSTIIDGTFAANGTLYKG